MSPPKPPDAPRKKAKLGEPWFGKLPASPVNAIPGQTASNYDEASNDSEFDFGADLFC